jgi:hypothetical protein
MSSYERMACPRFNSLHASIWKNNPKGTFEQWNPDALRRLDPVTFS